jgi:hypothetical protein
VNNKRNKPKILSKSRQPLNLKTMVISQCRATWKVSVKSKSDAFPSAVQIVAPFRKCTYVGATVTAPVHVTVSLWTINIPK